MSDFKVGCSPLYLKIYAGKVSKSGKWGRNKKDVTDTAPMAVAEYLMLLDQKIIFTNKAGKQYQLAVTEYQDEK